LRLLEERMLRAGRWKLGVGIGIGCCWGWRRVAESVACVEVSGGRVSVVGGAGDEEGSLGGERVRVGRLWMDSVVLVVVYCLIPPLRAQ